MKILFILGLLTFSVGSLAARRPSRYIELVKFVQPAPDQGESNTCWFMASTGAMELLLNRKYDVRFPKRGGRFDLSESFLIWQKDFYDQNNPAEHFIEDVVKKFNHGEAIRDKDWHFSAYNQDGTDSMEGWDLHEKFDQLPRIKVPPVKTELLFARGKRYATEVLEPEDIELMKTQMAKHRAPLIVNYNDDGYWHVVLIVGYDDNRWGDCYEIEKEDCKKGTFYVRDSNGDRWNRRAYNWFLQKGNAAALVNLK